MCYFRQKGINDNGKTETEKKKKKSSSRSSNSKIGLATPADAYRICMYKVRPLFFCFVCLVCHGQYMRVKSTKHEQSCFQLHHPAMITVTFSLLSSRKKTSKHNKRTLLFLPPSSFSSFLFLCRLYQLFCA